MNSDFYLNDSPFKYVIQDGAEPTDTFQMVIDNMETGENLRNRL
jgi:ribosomal protein S16